MGKGKRHSGGERSKYPMAYTRHETWVIRRFCTHLRLCPSVCNGSDRNRWTTDGALGEAFLSERHTTRLIFRELRRQGVNTNQGVRSLSTIAMFLNHGKALGEWVEEYFEHAELALNMASNAHIDIASLIKTLDERLLIGA